MYGKEKIADEDRRSNSCCSCHSGNYFCIQSDSRSVAEVKDTYVMAVPSGERSSTTYLFHFNVERKTYSEEAQTADMDPIVLSSGSYTCMEKDGAGILTARGGQWRRTKVPAGWKISDRTELFL